jgi:hypothetical protein
MRFYEYAKYKRVLLLIPLMLSVAFLSVLTSGCGKKGDLKPAWTAVQTSPPQKIEDLSVSVKYGKIWLNFTEPVKNKSGDGPANIEKYVVYYEVMELGADYCLTCPLNLANKIEIDPAYNKDALFEGGKADLPIIMYEASKKYVFVVRSISPEGAGSDASNAATINFAGQ